MSAVLGLSGSTLVGQRVGVQQRAKAANLKVVTSANVKKGKPRGTRTDRRATPHPYPDTTHTRL
jgi:hypothetical protein